jgi:hypothetical protein
VEGAGLESILPYSRPSEIVEKIIDTLREREKGKKPLRE